jgi:hypothetical protein
MAISTIRHPSSRFDLLAKANPDRALDRQSFLCSVHEYPNDAVSDLQDSREVPGFSALITGIAIVHTTGMPVAYSFGLGWQVYGEETEPGAVRVARSTIKTDTVYNG